MEVSEQIQKVLSYYLLQRIFIDAPQVIFKQGQVKHNLEEQFLLLKTQLPLVFQQTTQYNYNKFMAELKKILLQFNLPTEINDYLISPVVLSKMRDSQKDRFMHDFFTCFHHQLVQFISSKNTAQIAIEHNASVNNEITRTPLFRAVLQMVKIAITQCNDQYVKNITGISQISGYDQVNELARLKSQYNKLKNDTIIANAGYDQQIQQLKKRLSQLQNINKEQETIFLKQQQLLREKDQELNKLRNSIEFEEDPVASDRSMKRANVVARDSELLSNTVNTIVKIQSNRQVSQSPVRNKLVAAELLMMSKAQLHHQAPNDHSPKGSAAQIPETEEEEEKISESSDHSSKTKKVSQQLLVNGENSIFSSDDIESNPGSFINLI